MENGLSANLWSLFRKAEYTSSRIYMTNLEAEEKCLCDACLAYMLLFSMGHKRKII